MFAYRACVPRYKLTVAYDGTDFNGWQAQHPREEPGSDERITLRTVQTVLQEAVRSVVREEVTIVGASRTDSGVHARGQVAAFTSDPDPAIGRGWPNERGTNTLLRAVNSRLPDDVVVVNAEVVDDGFDPIIGATSKAYSYTLHITDGSDERSLRPLWDRRYVQQLYVPQDVGRMEEAAKRLVGEHDFVSFAAMNHGRQTTVRTILDCSVRELEPVEGARRIRIDVTGTGFLYNMVRIIAGTLVDVGRGKLSPDDIGRIIDAKDRREAGPTLPPNGLCLEWIKYER